MRRALLVLLTTSFFLMAPAVADEAGYDEIIGGAETTTQSIRVTVLKTGGRYEIGEVRGSGGDRSGCRWSLRFGPGLDDLPLFGENPGEKPHPEARLALLMCDAAVHGPVWVAPEDVIDLDALARQEAERYVEEVLRPDVSIGANPVGQGLVGLRSWFWVDGFAGSVTAPPITAFGMTIEVRMAAGGVRWDFGDGTVVDGDLGRPYPEESTVQHAHQRSGTYTVTAALDLVPEYRVDGGPWLALPNLTATASVEHPVEQRQAVVTRR